MRRIALLAVASGLVGWGLTSAISGCGGDTATNATPPDGAVGTSSGSSGTSGSSGSSGTSGSSGSSGDPGDAGPAPDGATSSGAVASNPGKITCGAVECDAGGGGGGGGGGGTANRCCVRDAGAGPVCSTADLCDNDDLELRCDETADCPTGIGGAQNKCCLRLGGGGGGGPRTECQLACGFNGGGIQVCKTSAECGDAGACALKKCGIYNLRVCGSPQGCM